jgi:hypothetical protein
LVLFNRSSDCKLQLQDSNVYRNKKTEIKRRNKNKIKIKFKTLVMENLCNCQSLLTDKDHKKKNNQIQGQEQERTIKLNEMKR